MKESSVNLFGEVLLKREVAGIVLTETAYAPNLKLSLHEHKQSYFCFVTQGNYEEFYDKRKRFCTPSMLIFHPSGEAHANRFYDAGGRCFNIQPAGEWTDRIKLNESIDVASSNIKSLVQRLYFECVRFDEFSPLSIEGLFLEMTADISRAGALRQTACAPWLKHVREILHDRFAEDLNIESLALAVSIHPVHLTRTFRQKFQCTIGEYVRRLRVDFACREISGSGKTLAEIAYLAGFSSQSHFTTVFKRLTGATPAEFRKKC